MKLIEIIFEILSTIIKGLFGFLQILFGNHPNDKLYEDSSMSYFQRLRVFSRFHKGLILNGSKQYTLSEKASKTHCCILGKSGIGKSSVYYTNILLRPGKKSFVVTDLDGGLFKTTSGYLKSIGYDIQVFDLSNVGLSCFYNPILFCENEDELRALAIQIIASSSTHSESSEKFWQHAATNLLFILFRLVKTQDEKYQNLANVRYLLTMIELEEFDLFSATCASDKLHQEILAFKAMDQKLRTNIEATLSATLDLLSYNDISFISSKNTISFERLRNPKAILYIICPERLLRQYSLIISTFYYQLLSYYQQHKPKNTIYFMLDEAGVYKINELEIMTSILRRYNLSLSIAAQDFKQFIQLYGREAAATIYSNCSTKVIFSASLELSEEISRASGKKTVEVNFEGRKEQQTRPVLTPTDILQMKSNKLLIQHAHYPFIQVRSHPFYKQIRLKLRSKRKPMEREQNTIIAPELILLEPIPKEFRYEK